MSENIKLTDLLTQAREPEMKPAFEERERLYKRLQESYPDISAEEQLKVFMRGVSEFLPSTSDLYARLKERRPLRIKLGVDPTSTDLHLGHTVVLQKMKQLQELGHHIDFLIGSFTALIGDPSGRNKTRPLLDEAAIMKNAQTYTDQAFRLLDPEKTSISFNHWWLKPLSFADIVKLASQITLARLIERDDFTKRLKAGLPISTHEILYPIMQAYDSVVLKTDVELGGTDQRFNLLAGRDFQIADAQTPQMVLMMPILAGTDGVEKMSKSLNNYIGIAEEPFTIYAKTMSIPDESIVQWFELLTDIDLSELGEIKREYENPDRRMPLKMKLAETLVDKYHGSRPCRECHERWVTEKQQRKLPSPEAIDIEIKASDLPLEEGGINIVLLVDAAKLKGRDGKDISRSEIKRKIGEGAVKVNGNPVCSPSEAVQLQKGYTIIQFGKQLAFKVKMD